MCEAREKGRREVGRELVIVIACTRTRSTHKVLLYNRSIEYERAQRRADEVKGADDAVAHHRPNPETVKRREKRTAE